MKNGYASLKDLLKTKENKHWGGGGQKILEFGGIMIVSSRPVWATQQDPVKKRKEERGERGKGGIRVNVSLPAGAHSANVGPLPAAVTWAPK